MDRRLRRLEKSVEALSHGLILALTRLKLENGEQPGDIPYAESHWETRSSSPDSRDEGEKTVTAGCDAAAALSTVLEGMGLSEKSTEKLYLRLLPLGIDCVYLQRMSELVP